jgi:hypothetical protein
MSDFNIEIISLSINNINTIFNDEYEIEEIEKKMTEIYYKVTNMIKGQNVLILNKGEKIQHFNKCTDGLLEWSDILNNSKLIFKTENGISLAVEFKNIKKIYLSNTWFEIHIVTDE